MLSPVACAAAVAGGLDKAPRQYADGWGPGEVNLLAGAAAD